jgi:hypothetical protein
MKRLLFAFLLSALVGACTSQPVYNFSRPIPKGADGLPLHPQEVGDAISESCRARQWKVVEVEPGRIGCSITVRGRHHANVDISFSSDGYSMEYGSSVGLEYRNGSIHRNYNKWVILLGDEIDRRLNIASGY